LRENKDFRAGFVALVGRPNVGKSTLLNTILGTKISIVSPKPQTTRMRILGVFHDKDAQIIFLDTPGIQKGKDILTKTVVESAVASMEEADIIAMIIDAVKGWTKDDEMLIHNYLEKLDKPTILIINKIDKVPKETILPLIDESTKKFNFKEIVPVSALKGTNLDRLVKVLKDYLPQSPPLFLEDQITDLPLKFQIAEIIREKAFNILKDELPYSVAVEVESIREGDKNKNLLFIDAVIYVERENHKKIVIGRKGQTIKKIGQFAREELEFLLNKKIHLTLWVKVKPKWKEDIRLLKVLGYQYIS